MHVIDTRTLSDFELAALLKSPWFGGTPNGGVAMVESKFKFCSAMSHSDKVPLVAGLSTASDVQPSLAAHSLLIAQGHLLAYLFSWSTHTIEDITFLSFFLGFF